MFGNDTNLLNCRLYDGVMQAMISEIVAKVASGELQLVVCSDDQIGSQNGATAVSPVSIFQDKYDPRWR